MSRGLGPFSHGCWLLSKLRKLVVLAPVKESSESDPALSRTLCSIGLVRRISSGVTLRSPRHTTWMAAPRACPDAPAPSGPRSCRVPCSWMVSRPRGGASFSSTLMMTTLSRAGWYQTSGKLGSNTIGNARSRRLSRTTSSSCINALVGREATGEATIPASSLRDTS